MKLDPTNVKYLSHDDYRVLQAIEVGSRTHEVVPTELIASIAKMRTGQVQKVMSDLCRQKLCNRQNNHSYEGYKLAYGGYDYMALRTFANRETLTCVGHQIGMGKESDIFLGSDPNNSHLVLKIQRLGRTSFRSVRNNRDYAGGGKKAAHASWMYLSRLGATKEWAFLQALHARGFPVPRPVDHNRHCVVMSLVMGKLLDNVQRDDMVIEGVTDPKLVDAAISWLYSELMNLILRLAEHGLIHGDFNEFNLIWEPPTKDSSFTESTESSPMGRIVIIDFPQMVSTRHPNAKFYFDRDVTCIKKFFERRFGFIAEDAPDFETDVQRLVELDSELKASGFDKVAREDDLIALHDTKENTEEECEGEEEQDEDEESIEEDEEDSDEDDEEIDQ